MHYGSVNDAVEANVSLDVHGENGATEQVAFIIDTGFTDEISLPQAVISRLGLPLSGYADEFILADGTTGRYSIYAAHILWHGQLREVEVVNLEGDPLVGMELLLGSNLNVDAIPGGMVTIAELPAESQPEMPC